ncbi:MAG: hypothetical protein HY882_08745, partial [Deltaproteobacteria bacterium]|nr:hypothetical protein [Deltaproteobacteria bacterium]
SPTTIPNLLRDFFATGMVEVDERAKFGVRAVLDGLLKPMGLIKKKGNLYQLQVDPRHNELAEHFFSLLEKGPLAPEALYWAFRKGEFGLLRNQFEVLVFALLFSGNIIAYQGQRKKGLEDISRNGLQGLTALGKGEILSEDLRALIPTHPLIPDKLRKGTFTLPSQEELWSEIKARKEKEVESLQNLLHRIRGTSSFLAFKNLPWDSLTQDVLDVLTQWEEVKVSFSAREGLERFLSAAAREPFLAEKLRRMEELKAFFDRAERVLFAYQYTSDPRLSLPDRSPYRELKEEKNDLLAFFEAGKISFAPEEMQKLLQRFHDFREKYVQVYVEGHRRARSGDQFAPYEKLRHSPRYLLLARLNQLEMISVQHNLSSVDRALSTVLFAQCHGPSLDALQSSPVCTCGFLLGEDVTFKPAREVEESIDLGIRETVEALNSPVYQEKLLPYVAGLEEVGEKEKASAIRKVLSLSSSRGETFLTKLDESLTPLSVQGINEAFRGRVVVVRRDLDQIYGALIHRKYSLSQVRKILRQWLREEEIAEGTFLEFIGRGEPGSAAPRSEGLPAFLEAEFPHLLPLLKETGQGVLQKALLLSLWSEEYGLPPREIFSLLPFLQKSHDEKGLLLIQQLANAGRSLREKDLRLFESLVEEVEREGEFPAKLWKLLAPRTALEIFHREGIFPSLLREAFERLLASPEGEGESPTPSSLESPLLPPQTPGFSARQKEMNQAWQAYGTLRQKLSALKRREGTPPRDFPKWESLYLQHLSPLSFLTGTLPGQFRRLEVSIPAPAKEHLALAENLCNSLSGSFAQFYRQACPGWEAGEGKRPKMIEDLLSLSPRKGSSAEDAGRIYVLLDGLRWDLWEYLKENFFTQISNQLRIVQEGALWAHLPSTTPRQMEFLEKSLGKVSGEERKRIWKIEGIDERVHTEKGTLEHLFGNVLQYLQLDLAPRLRDLPPKTLLIFFSDHGFIENPGFAKADKYRAPRYLHGEDSPFEIIVPWAMAAKI